MWRLLLVLLYGVAVALFATAPAEPIDRHALVSRHDIDWPDLQGQIPLGNGNFAFNADGTGLETFGGNTMSHWCWHSFPLPPGVVAGDIVPWATPDHGRFKPGATAGTEWPPEPIRSWERTNPAPLNLGRLGFIDAQGARLSLADCHAVRRHLDLWSGLLTTNFTYLGQAVTVETCVDPRRDIVAVRITSPLLRDGRLQMMLDFPSPAQNVGGWVGDFSQAAGHQTTIINQTGDRLELNRAIDDTHYQVVVTGSGFTVGQPAVAQPEIVSARYGAERGPDLLEKNVMAPGGWIDVKDKVTARLHDQGSITSGNALAGDPALHLVKHLEITYRLNGSEQTKSLAEGETWSVGGASSPHRFTLTPGTGTNSINLACYFGINIAAASVPNFDEVKAACAAWWPAFWQSGGAIDLSQSRDPRWMELERRIVLSQYELAVQSAGDYPPAEVGLTGTDPWRAKWHFEMIWWHLAHYALWDRWAMADKALGIYKSITPVARSIAQNFGYQGLMWPKTTGPNGYNDGFPPEMALLWKEPPPIFFAELDYRLHPTPATLDKWKDIVFGTAAFMADYPTRDATGQYNLDPCWPASEGGLKLYRNCIFELGYWRWGLEMAQQWRIRCGLSREPHWDEVLQHLAPLPVENGLYVFGLDRPNCYLTRRFDHIDIIGVCGMLPPFAGLDPATAHRTVMEVARSWQWDGCWGWDFPWMAMAAARVGEPQAAVEALLNPSVKNHYDERGLNTGGPPPYLPGNGGLLYAVAMMAAGWDGAPNRPAPGFPTDGSWTVRYEGLKPAP